MLSRISLCLLAVGLLLFVIQQALGVMPYYGIEDYLGWIQADAIKSMNDAWKQHNIRSLASVYLWVDTALFVPIYGIFFLELGRQLFAALAADSSGQFSRLWTTFYAGLLVSLLIVDLVENVAGLVKVSAGVTEPVLCVLLSFAIWHRLLKWFQNISPSASEEIKRYCLQISWPPLIVALGIGYGLVTVQGMKDDGKCFLAVSELHDRVGCLAHQAKVGFPGVGLVGFLVLLILGLALWWLSGLRIPRSKSVERAERGELRIAIADIVGRSRYVLAALVIFSGAAVVMNQGRDLLGATASQVSGLISHVAAAQTDFTNVLAGFSGLIGLIVSAISVWMLSFSCWLWSRSAGQASHEHSQPPIRPHFPLANQFAREWARFLGLVPLIIIVLLCAATIGDATRVHASRTALVLAAFCIAAVYFGYRFVNRRIEVGEASGKAGGYYNCWVKPMRCWPLWGTGSDHARYSLFGRISPFWLPIAAAILMFACRFPLSFLDRSYNLAPPMALPTMLLAIVVWLGLFGWLSLFEQRTSTAWVGVLIIIVGALGFIGITDNHVVGGFLILALPILPEEAELRMYAFTIGISITVFAVYAYVLRSVRERQSLSPWRGLLAFVLLIVGCAGFAIGIADNSAANLPADPRSATVEIKEPNRQTLAVALKQWLDTLYEHHSRESNKVPVPVYFIASEGGGIRAAYWTASVLTKIEERDSSFPERTFSMSGVSGGAMGIAVYRACRHHEQGALSCVASFGRQDLLSPLVGAWLYEDLLATVIPTSYCDAPGCGFLSRGAWFENAMLEAVPQLKQGLVASRSHLGWPHNPYLFLNSSWVETGERAIASDVVIDSKDFPNANDQVRLLGRDISLVTAAHNASRFPFINAIGAVKPLAKEHSFSAPKEAGQEVVPANPLSVKKGLIGHLADGGYFDNSGGHTTADILITFSRCFIDKSSDCWIEDSSKRMWLARHLVPQVLMIRNGIEIPLPDQGQYGKNQCRPTKQPDAQYLYKLRPDDLPYQPWLPGCQGQLTLFADFLGPVVTAVGAITSNSHLAEARLYGVTLALRGSLAAVAGRVDEGERSPIKPVLNIDHVSKDQLVPLGWHLSSAAQESMDKAVRNDETIHQLGSR